MSDLEQDWAAALQEQENELSGKVRGEGWAGGGSTSSPLCRYPASQ